LKHPAAAAALLAAALFAGASWCAAAPARMLVVSANDQASGYAGGMFVRPGARPGGVTVVDFSASPVRAWHVDGVPCSVIGPPSCVAVGAGGVEILVASAMQPDPAAPEKLRPDTRVTRLRATPGGWEQTAQTSPGAQPSGIALSRDARQAWVALRAEGAVARLALDDGGGLRLAGKTSLASAADSLSDIELSPDERTAFATLHTAAALLVLRVEADGGLVEKQRLQLPRGAYHIGFLPDGKRALAGCTVDDVLCVLEEEHDGAWRIRETIPTGRTPEGVFISPDGRWVAVTCFDGANMLVRNNPWFGQPSRVYIYSINKEGAIRREQALELKNVLQGAAFTADSRTLVAGQFGEGNLRVFQLKEGAWGDSGQVIEIPGQSAALAATRD
jgi:6-phosphogluconolactonase (cycloisomerase 2 family)